MDTLIILSSVYVHKYSFLNLCIFSNTSNFLWVCVYWPSIFSPIFSFLYRLFQSKHNSLIADFQQTTIISPTSTQKEIACVRTICSIPQTLGRSRFEVPCRPSIFLKLPTTRLLAEFFSTLLFVNLLARRRRSRSVSPLKRIPIYSRLQRN